MSIDDILNSFDGCGVNSGCKDSDNAKQQLLELLESCKPDELPIDSTEFTAAFIGGFNRATKQYHSNIRKLFDEDTSSL